MKISPQGHVVQLNVSDPLHFNGKVKKHDGADDVSTSFRDMLNGAVQKVNNLQVDSEDLSKRMMIEPESVDIHEVMIASQKAEIALTFAKSIKDEAINAYRDLINLR